MMDTEERAERAKRLLEDDVFAEILTIVRQDAVDKMADAEPASTELIQAQQLYRLTTDIYDRLLAAAHIATGERDGGVSV